MVALMLPDNSIHVGDCNKIMQHIDVDSIDLIVTDPPYGKSYKTNYRQQKDHEFSSVIKNDNNLDLVIETISLTNKILKQNSALYIFCTHEKQDEIILELNKYFNVKNRIIWIKNNWTAGDLNGSFGYQYEVLIMANKGNSKIRGKRYSDVWHVDRVVGNEQYHQNQKPLDLIKRCITSHSDINDLIFDPFMGSGTTCVAAKMLGRRYIGIDMEQKYVDIAQRRLDAVNLDLFINTDNSNNKTTEKSQTGLDL